MEQKKMITSSEASELTYQSSGKELLKSVPPHKNPVKLHIRDISNFDKCPGGRKRMPQLMLWRLPSKSQAQVYDAIMANQEKSPSQAY